MDRLPPDVLYIICGNLWPRDLESLGLVCRRLHQITQYDSLWGDALESTYRKCGIYDASFRPSHHRRAWKDLQRLKSLITKELHPSRVRVCHRAVSKITNRGDLLARDTLLDLARNSTNLNTQYQARELLRAISWARGARLAMQCTHHPGMCSKTMIGALEHFAETGTESRSHADLHSLKALGSLKKVQALCAARPVPKLQRVLALLNGLASDGLMEEGRSPMYSTWSIEEWIGRKKPARSLLLAAILVQLLHFLNVEANIVGLAGVYVALRVPLHPEEMPPNSEGDLPEDESTDELLKNCIFIDPNMGGAIRSCGSMRRLARDVMRATVAFGDRPVVIYDTCAELTPVLAARCGERRIVRTPLTVDKNGPAYLTLAAQGFEFLPRLFSLLNEGQDQAYKDPPMYFQQQVLDQFFNFRSKQAIQGGGTQISLKSYPDGCYTELDKRILETLDAEKHKVESGSKVEYHFGQLVVHGEIPMIFIKDSPSEEGFAEVMELSATKDRKCYMVSSVIAMEHISKDEQLVRGAMPILKQQLHTMAGFVFDGYNNDTGCFYVLDERIEEIRNRVLAKKLHLNFHCTAKYSASREYRDV